MLLSKEEQLLACATESDTATYSIESNNSVYEDNDHHPILLFILSSIWCTVFVQCSRSIWYTLCPCKSVLNLVVARMSTNLTFPALFLHQLAILSNPCNISGEGQGKTETNGLAADKKQSWQQHLQVGCTAPKNKKASMDHQCCFTITNFDFRMWIRMLNWSPRVNWLTLQLLKKLTKIQIENKNNKSA